MTWPFMGTFDPLAKNPDEDIVLIDLALEPGQIMCVACGSFKKAPKHRRPMPVADDPKVRAPRGEPVAALQSVVNMAAGFEVFPVPPPAEVEEDHEPLELTTVKQPKMPAITVQKQKNWDRYDLDFVKRHLGYTQHYIQVNQDRLRGALRSGETTKIEKFEAKLSFFLRRESLLASVITRKEAVV